jgi:non-ribosomal peptide synthetase component F
MFGTGIHRIIEHHAATRGDELALVGDADSLTYRELNQRANAVARRLLANGFRRGARAVVKMNRSAELAIVLLAILKAGGAYTWLDADDPADCPDGLSIVLGDEGPETNYLTIGLRQLLEDSAPQGPNLPILTRAADIACVLPQRNGAPGLLVPHATITALQSHPVPTRARWSTEPGALDLWVPLMTGATLFLTTTPSVFAAA